jgi:hypothetical protein
MVRTGNGFARKGNSPAYRSLRPLDCPRDDEVGHAEALAEVAGEDPRQRSGALSREHCCKEQCGPEGIHNRHRHRGFSGSSRIGVITGALACRPAPMTLRQGAIAAALGRSLLGSLLRAGSEAPRGFWTSLAVHLRKQSGSALESPSRRNRKADVLAG